MFALRIVFLAVIIVILTVAIVISAVVNVILAAVSVFLAVGKVSNKTFSVINFFRKINFVVNVVHCQRAFNRA
jgi:hypothetical protein